MAGKKASRPRTPAEKDAAALRTKTRKDDNRKSNEAKAAANKSDTELERYGLVNLQPLKRGTEGAPKTNKGNGSPTRLSQIKRAVARNGITHKKDK